MVLMSILIVVGLIAIVTLVLHGATARCSDPYKNKKYILKRCKITQIPKNIPKETTKLDLSFNQIQYISSGAFKNLPNCTELNMGKNRLTHIRTQIFDGLSSLEDLDLRSNKISDIDPGSFFRLPKCTHLWLPFNQLTYLKAEPFKGLVSLDLLDLYSNQISFIEDGTFSHLPRIRVIYLSNNNLVTPPQTHFLFLDGNPLHCDSRMCWLKQAERDGKLKLRGRWNHKPQCVNYPGLHWDNITLICDESGKYNDILFNSLFYVLTQFTNFTLMKNIEKVKTWKLNKNDVVDVVHIVVS